jgi:hypothetical protein
MTGPAAKRIRLRWQGRCAGCSRELAEGSYAWHCATSRTLRCDECAEEAPALDAETESEPRTNSTAGSSAHREYKRRRQAREDRARRRLGGLGVALARLSGEPQHIRSWKQGAEGERKLAERLEKRTAGAGVLFLHDRRIPGTRANIDHLAIAPGGVTVIDAKALRGKVRAERRGGLFSPRTEHLLIAGRDRTHLIEGLRRQVIVVSAALADFGRDDISVRGALCLLDASGLPWFGTVAVDALPVIGVRKTTELISRAGDMDAEQLRSLHRMLAQRFLPA